MKLLYENYGLTHTLWIKKRKKDINEAIEQAVDKYQQEKSTGKCWNNLEPTSILSKV